MKPLRLAICSSSFWPITNGRSWWVNDFCRFLVETGHLPEVFTSRWTKDGPVRFLFNDIPVRRFFQNQWPAYGQFRYWREIGQSIAESVQGRPHEPIDAMIVVDNPRNAVAAIRLANRYRLPLIVRADDSWIDANVRSRYVAHVRSRLHRSMMQLVAPCRGLHFALEDSFSLGARATVIDDGILLAPVKPEICENKIRLRESFSLTHPMLQVEADRPQAVYIGPFDPPGDLVKLVETWRRVLQRNRRARLWIVGWGGGGRLIWDAIVRNELVNDVIMPGLFDHFEDLLTAADVFVWPHQSVWMENRYVLAAVSQGVPVLSRDHSILPIDTGKSAANDKARSIREYDESSLPKVICDAFNTATGREPDARQPPPSMGDRFDFRKNTGPLYLQLLEKLIGAKFVR